ncbi:FumA C-terminus/TtdB family hydratase beta subunit [Dictyoglomus thermophilum]|uniref:Fumarate hydratase, beta subunit n=2 Tax=Dictyoglomus thermophilum TaxID=14 RepID=B5YEU6_DICT6|nr:FumA C-terminus/TtdB family hydratase beta subunit [Dictyoglomus thermophilum]ACI19189.1 fumarate hydratase, beta subunit [Dictyoglomus thermophilum H-6-12]MCX7719690.1 FumA C-terminus/TtdB family hydratase beta subunit [Dictyoglomus thermophilum]TYT21125.1 fumarate hydratase [Dictyoglomus thermophilum]
MKKIHLPEDIGKLEEISVGEWILLNGALYSARDQACKRIVDMLEKGLKPPINLKDIIIYHMGPSPAPPGRVVGSAGPTTSKRMDPFVAKLMKNGVKGFIGKGLRGREVIEAIRKYKGFYLVTVGGAGAYLGDRIKSMKVVAFPELGPEAVYYLEVLDFPVLMAIDSKGNSFWEI